MNKRQKAAHLDYLTRERIFLEEFVQKTKCQITQLTVEQSALQATLNSLIEKQNQIIENNVTTTRNIDPQVQNEMMLTLGEELQISAEARQELEDLDLDVPCDLMATQ